jgi:hypothetical protein
MESTPRPLSTDPGLQVINAVYEKLNIAAKWTVWEDRGFTWWGGFRAQRVWSEQGVEDDGVTVYRLHARTDLYAGFAETDDQYAIVDILGTMATLNGIIRNQEHGDQLQVAASVFVHAENVPWAYRLFSLAVAMQSVEVKGTFGRVGLEFGLEPALSAHPQSGIRHDGDRVVNVIPEILDKGQGTSSYAGPELEHARKMLDRPPRVLCTGDSSGFAIEFPFPEHTSLLRYETQKPHCVYGAGLAAQLTLPIGNAEHETRKQALEFNQAEISEMTGANFVGSWCATEQGLSFVSFFPNLMHATDVTPNIVMNQVIRANWITRSRWNFSWDDNFKQSSESKLAMIAMISQPPKKTFWRKLFDRGDKSQPS